MTTSIIITGQIMSVSTLRNAIIGKELKINKLQGNSIDLIFKTKKEAVKALSNAYQYLKQDETVSYSRGGSLSYDAGNAYITN
jgi:hypothetical protein